MYYLQSLCFNDLIQVWQLQYLFDDCLISFDAFFVFLDFQAYHVLVVVSLAVFVFCSDSCANVSTCSYFQSVKN